MKKIISMLIVVALTVCVASCGGKKAAPVSSTPEAPQKDSAQPIIDASKHDAIETELAKYEDIVTRLLSDTEAKNEAAIKADQETLAGISERLSELATDFNPLQLDKYNELTAKLNN
jgi:hypothetical protein